MSRDDPSNPNEPPALPARAPRLPRLSLMLARFCLSAWVGAATLFVVTGVQEVRSPAFDSVTKGQLAAIRFPNYYAFGFALLTASLITAWLGRKAAGRTRSRVILGLSAVALGTMLIDCVWIYGPLHAMVTAPAEARPASFVTYHRLTMLVNAAHLLLSLAAALLLCWPVPQPHASRDHAATR